MHNDKNTSIKKWQSFPQTSWSNYRFTSKMTTKTLRYKLWTVYILYVCKMSHNFNIKDKNRKLVKQTVGEHFLKYVFIFTLKVWVFCLLLCLCTKCGHCLQNPEEGIASCETGDTKGLEQPGGSWEPNPILYKTCQCS